MVEQQPDALDEVLAFLDTLEPMQRARWLGAVLDRRNAPRLRAERVALIYEATRRWTYDSVAAELGVAWSAVRNAVKAHGENVTARAQGHTESIETSAAQAAQREDKTVTTTTNLGSFGRYTQWYTPKDMVLDFLADQADSFDVDGLVNAFRDAINAELAESGIALRGSEFYGPYPAPEDTAELIDAAIEAVDLGELAAAYDNALEG